ncbi:MAG: 4Fe-4S dicluster domain-containing protein [Spirochaetales bacterium]|nr:MAG: 4Fe-4S dicluster domain-containing protein [Spirochaetales bacterium]
MSNVRSFRHGGILLPQRIHFDHGPIENAFLPINAIVVLNSASTGRTSRIAVTEGEEVREGQLIARFDGKGTLNAHSPIPGIVRKIIAGKNADGTAVSTITISLAGSFSVLGKKPERYLWKSLNKTDIMHIVQEKGVARVSSGESLYDILHDMRGTSAPRFVLNALEMDPYCRAEEAILLERSADIVDACAILKKILQTATMTVALGESFPEAEVASLLNLAEKAEVHFEIQRFRRRYPQDMPSLIDRTLSRNSGKAVVSLMLEPSTMAALHDAVVSNKAHIEQYVYIGGGAVKESRILKARIGTPIGDLFEESGGFTGRPEVIVVNDPLRGTMAGNLDVAVEKTTRAILALTHDETHSARELPCVRCGACVRACPEGLKPWALNKYAMAGLVGEAADRGLYRCTSCGACAYACWSRIPLVDRFERMKSQGQS